MEAVTRAPDIADGRILLAPAPAASGVGVAGTTPDTKLPQIRH